MRSTPVFGSIGLSALAKTGSILRAAFFFRSFLDQIDHVRVHVDSINFSAWSRRLGQSESKITTARSEVNDNSAGLDLERSDDFLRLLPGVTFDAFIGALFEPGATR